jgi:transmembrane sensor
MFPGTPIDKTRQSAAQWSWRLISGELSAQEQASFREWVTEPGSGSELNAHHTVVNLAQDLPASLKSALVNETFPEPSGSEYGRRLFLKPMWISAMAATLVAVAVVGAWTRAWSSLRPAVELFSHSYSTEVGEVRNITLPDGSTVDLNTRSRLRWLGSKSDRRVQLVDGEALFEVVHDPARPFRILVDNSQIRVVGTRFDVYRKASSGNVLVTVLSGRVAVEGYDGGGSSVTAKPSWSVLLTANQQIEYSPTGLVGAVHSTVAPKSVEWLQGVFQAEQVPLADFVEELRRYTTKSVVADDAHATCSVGGIFTILDVPSVLSKLQRSGSVTVTSTDHTYVLTCRSDSAPTPAPQSSATGSGVREPR